MPALLTTERLLLRDWDEQDAAEAFAVYGTRIVSEWLVPSLPQVADVAQMREVLRSWGAEQQQATMIAPLGRWAIVHQARNEVIGGAELRPLPPHEEDLELAWQLRPQDWGHGFATESVDALMRWGFQHDAAELFAVIHPANERAIASANRLGMQWVGTTAKYYGRLLEAYRIRPDDLS